MSDSKTGDSDVRGRPSGGIPAPHRVTSRGWRFITSDKPVQDPAAAPAAAAAPLNDDDWDRVRDALSPGGAA